MFKTCKPFNPNKLPYNRQRDHSTKRALQINCLVSATDARSHKAQ